jgi:hypothetical protein
MMHSFFPSSNIEISLVNLQFTTYQCSNLFFEYSIYLILVPKFFESFEYVTADSYVQGATARVKIYILTVTFCDKIVSKVGSLL